MGIGGSGFGGDSGLSGASGSSPIPNPQSPIPGFTALVIGPGGGRDLVSALVFGAGHVDGVEINPIIANDVMRGQFREYSGGIYTHPRVRIVIDDGRSFVRRTPDHYDVIQASLVDTWAATARRVYLDRKRPHGGGLQYLDHPTDDGVLTITRWVMDGLRLVSLAQAACESRGWRTADRLAIIQHDRVATFLLKKSPFTSTEVARLLATADRLGFRVLYAPGVDGSAPFVAPDEIIDETSTGSYAKLITTNNRRAFFSDSYSDLSPTTDDRPFYFHTTKIENQFHTAFGRSMLFGNGLSALMTLMMISVALVILFVLAPLFLASRSLPRGWFAWLVYFGALGAGFMLIEVSILQRFVLLLGHANMLADRHVVLAAARHGAGAAWSRRLDDKALVRSASIALVLIAVVGILVISVLTPLIAWAIPFARPVRIAIAVGTLLPVGMLLGVPMPAGLRLLQMRAPQMIAWAWGINGALSVLGATVAIFIAMNWGFRVTLLTASATYLVGLVALGSAARRVA